MKVAADASRGRPPLPQAKPRGAAGRAFAKRAFDLSAAALGLLLLLPVFAVIAAMIKLDSPGPVLFRQERVGLRGRTFRICKFRTMKARPEPGGTLITIGRDSRITRIGAVLRKYKFDELPQLINIALGQMSFVGPRPEVPYYVNMYSEEQLRVLDVRPGLTDDASIKYSDENALLAGVSHPERVYIEQIMPDKLRINLQYVAEPSLRKDLEIIWKTLVKLVS
ncbi:sugar transferase [Paenibacillus cymbidii]|uniref:sugar transferase n=1 Tax=Paenibacillus cymbidii TaxID=1639034 RepID=UPI001081FA91|nr:sugar transferase [Paenibacillus cymbidii]